MLDIGSIVARGECIYPITEAPATNGALSRRLSDKVLWICSCNGEMMYGKAYHQGTFLPELVVDWNDGS